MSIDLRVDASFFLFSISLRAFAFFAATSSGISGIGGMLSAYMLKGLEGASAFGGPVDAGEFSLLCQPGRKSSTDLPDFGGPTLWFLEWLRAEDDFGVAILGRSCIGMRSWPATSRLLERASSEAISSVIPLFFGFFLIAGPVRQDSLPLSTLASRSS